MPYCSSEYFQAKIRELIPEALKLALLPLVEQIEALTKGFRGYDEAIATMAAEKYTDTVLLQQVQGVGALNALTFMLTIEYPDRFQNSRDVGHASPCAQTTLIRRQFCPWVYGCDTRMLGFDRLRCLKT